MPAPIRLIFLLVSMAITQALAADADDRPTLWSGLTDFSPTLRKFHEPDLWALDDKAESYRIYVDASIVFRESIVRLDRLSTDRWRVTTKTRFHNHRQTWTRYLKAAQVEEAITRLNDEKFWRLPADMVFVDPGEKESDALTSICIDETYWIVEAHVGGRYHGSGVQLCGRDAVFIPAGIALLRLTGRKLGPLGDPVSEEEVWPK